jgi:hypothetical protein
MEITRWTPYILLAAIKEASPSQNSELPAMSARQDSLSTCFQCDHINV